MPEGPDTLQYGSGLRLAELVMSLSLATDLGMGQPMEWALRSCLVGVRLGEELGLSEGELSDVYYLALLHYLGCTADSDRTAEVFGDEIVALRRLSEGDAEYWTRSADQGWVRESNVGRCEVAENLAERIGFGEGVRHGLWQLFERWDGLGLPNGLAGEELSLPVRVVRLAQDAETSHRLRGTEGAAAALRERSGGALDPWLVDRSLRSIPRLLSALGEGSAWEAVLAAEPGARPVLSGEELDGAIGAMADFADVKSRYFVGHSGGVARLVAAAAKSYGLPEGDARDTRRAALLQDVGRVGVSTNIWGKPGPLTDAERERVRLHPYYTGRILSRPGPLARLGGLGAMHHERPDGAGYHRGLASPALPPAALLLAAADGYQAMIEPRPHRPALAPEAAADELRREAKAGRLDGEAAEACAGRCGPPVEAGEASQAARRADKSRGGGAAPPLPRPLQPADSRAPLHLPQDGGPPRPAHLRQDRRLHPARSHHVRHTARPPTALRPGLSPGSWGPSPSRPTNPEDRAIARCRCHPHGPRIFSRPQEGACGGGEHGVGLRTDTNTAEHRHTSDGGGP